MGTRRLCCLVVFLFIASVYSFKTLYKMKDLSKVKFGKTVPRHGLLLLYWLVCAGKPDNNGNLRLNFKPGEGHFGFHLYKNYNNVFPNLANTNYAYYTVGNLNLKTENLHLPRYVTEDFKNDRHPQKNIDRIVIKVQKNNPALVNEMYITQHVEDRNLPSDYDESLTYEISKELLEEIAEYCIKKKDKEDPSDQRFARIQQKFQNYPLLQAFLYQTGYEGTWGHDLSFIYYTSKGQCMSNCETAGSSYYWCYTSKRWDYCSPKQNRDYNGNLCRDNHPCGKHGYSYYWCYKKDGGWGYCGKVEPKNNLHYSSTYQKICIDDCVHYERSDYFWCNTKQGWDYCSPLTNVTYKNEPCRSGYTCDTHGYDYTWCPTDSSSAKCGVVKSVIICYTPQRKKRQSDNANNNEEIFCDITDDGNKKLTKFQARRDPSAFTNRSGYENELSNIISRWNNTYLSNQTKSNLISTENLRIDLQGLINHDNQRYYNLQIQVNKPLKSGTSTTLAQVLIPINADVLDRCVRRGFTESFQNQSRIFIHVSSCNPSRA